MANFDLLIGGVLIAAYGLDVWIHGNFSGTALFIGGLLVAFSAAEKTNA